MATSETKSSSEHLQEKWDGSFAGLQTWVARTGGLPSRRSSDADEYSLANWLNRQRTDARKGVLEPPREQLLRTIPGALEPRARRLSDLDLAERVASFHTERGRLPRQRADGESTAAGYLGQLRAKAADGSISADAMKVVAAIPGAVDEPARRGYTVDERLQQLSEYLTEHGYLPPVGANGLYRWLWLASRGEATADVQEAERARRSVQTLVEGYPRRVKRPRTVVSRYLAELEEYVALHGHLPSAGPDGEPQFRRERLKRLLAFQGISESKAARINALLSAPSWRQGNTEGPARIAAFYAENGRLPRQSASSPENTLARRLSLLRGKARNGRMSPAAIEILAGVPGALAGPRG